MNRRHLLTLGAGAIVAAPFGLARELAKRDVKKIPRAKASQILTASSWNALVDRINELGEAP